MGEMTGTGYLAAPAAGAGLGLIVLQESWGLVPHMKDVCDRFAAEGFTAFAPDLFHGRTTTDPDEAARLLTTLDLDQAAQDMSAAVDFLDGSEQVRGEGVGVIGFCMGGGLALLLGTVRPDAVRAVVPFYGVIPPDRPQPDWSKLEAPVQGHFAEKDAHIPAELVRELEAHLKSLDKDVEVFMYDGVDHAFFNDTRTEVYDEQAASMAWVRTLEFLRAKLG
jgi:carboxymethylenebutenolidase